MVIDLCLLLLATASLLLLLYYPLSEMAELLTVRSTADYLLGFISSNYVKNSDVHIDIDENDQTRVMMRFKAPNPFPEQSEYRFIVASGSSISIYEADGDELGYVITQFVDPSYSMIKGMVDSMKLPITGYNIDPKRYENLKLTSAIDFSIGFLVGRLINYTWDAFLNRISVTTIACDKVVVIDDRTITISYIPSFVGGSRIIEDLTISNLNNIMYDLFK